MTEKIDHFTADPFVMSIGGMLIYFALLCGTQMKANKKLTFKTWINEQAVHVIIGLILAFAMVAYDDEIVEGYNNDFGGDLVWPKYWYLLGGIWLNILYQVVANITKIINVFLKKFITFGNKTEYLKTVCSWKQCQNII